MCGRILNWLVKDGSGRMPRCLPRAFSACSRRCVSLCRHAARARVSAAADLHAAPVRRTRRRPISPVGQQHDRRRPRRAHADRDFLDQLAAGVAARYRRPIPGLLRRPVAGADRHLLADAQRLRAHRAVDHQAAIQPRPDDQHRCYSCRSACSARSSCLAPRAAICKTTCWRWAWRSPCMPRSSCMYAAG